MVRDFGNDSHQGWNDINIFCFFSVTEKHLVNLVQKMFINKHNYSFYVN